MNRQVETMADKKSNKKAPYERGCKKNQVPGAGIEPARPNGHENLYQIRFGVI